MLQNGNKEIFSKTFLKKGMPIFYPIATFKSKI